MARVISVFSIRGHTRRLSPRRNERDESESVVSRSAARGRISDLEAQGAVFFAEHPGTNSEALQVMQYIDRLADVRSGKPLVVLGCGPKPDTLAKIAQCGFNAVGVEPIAALVESANRWREGHRRVLQGQAESLAVHWLTYARLCKLGRRAGFGQFYAKLDPLEPGDSAARSWLRRNFLKWFKYRPWLRSLALVHYCNSIFTVKRAAPRESAA